MHLGNYEVLKSLGDGSFGEVFLAIRTGAAGFSRQVAIKRLRPSVAADPDLVQAFAVEARICGLLNHPNVIQVFDFVESPEGYLLVMEHLEGIELQRVQKLLRRQGRVMPLQVAVNLACQLCEGLHCVHQAQGPGGQSLEINRQKALQPCVIITRPHIVKIKTFAIDTIPPQPWDWPGLLPHLFVKKKRITLFPFINH